MEENNNLQAEVAPEESAPTENAEKMVKKSKKSVHSQAETVDESTLSEDELYAKIQTEKLLKRKQTKKIATLSGLCVAMVLAVCLIILAAVPISLKPSCIKSGFYDVKLYAGSSAPAVFVEGEEEFDAFLKYYSKSFSQTCLAAMFNGGMGTYNIDEQHVKVDERNVLSKVKELAGSGNNLVRLGFDEERHLTKKNGRTYHSIYSNSRWDGVLKFDEAYFVVNQEKGVKNTSVYIVAEYPDYGTCLVILTVKADTSILYEAWDKLV